MTTEKSWRRIPHLEGFGLDNPIGRLLNNVAGRGYVSRSDLTIIYNAFSSLVVSPAEDATGHTLERTWTVTPSSTVGPTSAGYVPEVARKLIKTANAGSILLGSWSDEDLDGARQWKRGLRRANTNLRHRVMSMMASGDSGPWADEREAAVELLSPVEVVKCGSSGLVARFQMHGLLPFWDEDLVPDCVPVVSIGNSRFPVEVPKTGPARPGTQAMASSMSSIDSVMNASPLSWTLMRTRSVWSSCHLAVAAIDIGDRLAGGLAVDGDDYTVYTKSNNRIRASWDVPRATGAVIGTSPLSDMRDSEITTDMISKYLKWQNQ